MTATARPANPVGSVYCTWWALMLILSLPLMAVTYTLGVVWFMLRLAFRAGYLQSEKFPEKITLDEISK
jgi:hypothetical protein